MKTYQLLLCVVSIHFSVCKQPFEGKFLLHGCKQDGIKKLSLIVPHIEPKVLKQIKWIAFPVGATLKIKNCVLKSPTASSEDDQMQTIRNGIFQKEIPKTVEFPDEKFAFYELDSYGRDLIASLADSDDKIMSPIIFSQIDLDHFGKDFHQSKLSNEFKLSCVSGINVTLDSGSAFGYCGVLDKIPDSFNKIFGYWKKNSAMMKSKFKEKLLGLVGAITASMFLCIVCCICCKLNKDRKNRYLYAGRRKGSNVSSSLRTRESEI